MGNENSVNNNGSADDQKADESAKTINLDDGYKILSLVATDPYTLLKQKNYGENTVLHLATIDDNLEVFQLILRQAVKKLKINQLIDCLASRNELGKSVLHLAAEKGSLEFIKILFGGEEHLFTSELLFQFITIKDVLGYTALHLAVQNNHFETVRYLLDPVKNRLSAQQQLEYIMMTNQDERTALHLAALNGNFNIVKLLNEAELFSFFTSGFLMLKDSTGHTAFQLTVLNRHYAIAKFLLNLGEDDVSDAEITLCKRLKRTLETYRLDIGDEEDYEYVKSCLNSSGKILSIKQQRKVLMTTGLYKRSVIHSAAVKNHEKTLKLIFQRCDVILSLEERTELLMQQDDFGATALHLAAPYNHFEIVKLLMNKCSMLGTSEDRKKFWTLTSNFGDTAFHLAVKFSNLECIKLMLEEVKEIGAIREVLSISNEHYETVFHLAVERKNDDYMLLLWDSAKIALRSSELNYLMFTQNKLKETAFHLAISHGLLKMAESMFSENILFIETRKKLLMATDYCRNTVLHSATRYNHQSTFQWLLDKSAILSFEERKALLLLKDNHEYTVFHLAVECDLGILQLLLKFMHQLFSQAVFQKIFRMKTKFWDTVFHLAASSTRMKLLLHSAKKVFTPQDIGKLILAKNDDNNTVLHLAVERGDLASVQMFFESSAVHFEQQKNLLMETDSYRRTALHWAAFNEHILLVKFLLSKIQNLLDKSDQQEIINLKDCDDKTASDLISSGQQEIKVIILDALNRAI